MQLFFLDVVDAEVSRSVDLTLVVVVAVTILVEMLLMWVMKYNPFGKSLLDSGIVNMASLAAGYVLLEMVPGLFGKFDIPSLLILMLITIAVELPLLYLLNRKKPFLLTLGMASFINGVSYLLFYIWVAFQ